MPTTEGAPGRNCRQWGERWGACSEGASGTCKGERRRPPDTLVWSSADNWIKDFALVTVSIEGVIGNV